MKNCLQEILFRNIQSIRSLEGEKKKEDRPSSKTLFFLISHPHDLIDFIENWNLLFSLHHKPVAVTESIRNYFILQNTHGQKEKDWLWAKQSKTE